MRKALEPTERTPAKPRLLLQERNSRIQVQTRDTGAEDGHGLAQIRAVAMHGITHAT